MNVVEAAYKALNAEQFEGGNAYIRQEIWDKGWYFCIPRSLGGRTKGGHIYIARQERLSSSLTTSSLLATDWVVMDRDPTASSDD